MGMLFKKQSTDVTEEAPVETTTVSLAASVLVKDPNAVDEWDAIESPEKLVSDSDSETESEGYHDAPF
jgi:hypothetical protein